MEKYSHQHPLKLSEGVYDEGWFCDICSQPGKTKSLFHCTECEEFDVCFDCYAKFKKPAYMHNKHEHPLVEVLTSIVYKGHAGFYCDVCEGSTQPQHHCDRCDFDLCHTCFLKDSKRYEAPLEAPSPVAPVVTISEFADSPDSSPRATPPTTATSTASTSSAAAVATTKTAPAAASGDATKTSASVPVKHWSHPHELHEVHEQVYAGDEGWFCDECESKDCFPQHHCTKCEFALCHKCFLRDPPKSKAAVVAVPVPAAFPKKPIAPTAAADSDSDDGLIAWSEQEVADDTPLPTVAEPAPELPKKTETKQNVTFAPSVTDAPSAEHRPKKEPVAKPEAKSDVKSSEVKPESKSEAGGKPVVKSESKPASEAKPEAQARPEQNTQNNGLTPEKKPTPSSAPSASKRSKKQQEAAAVAALLEDLPEVAVIKHVGRRNLQRRLWIEDGKICWQGPRMRKPPRSLPLSALVSVGQNALNRGRPPPAGCSLMLVSADKNRYLEFTDEADCAQWFDALRAASMSGTKL